MPKRRAPGDSKRGREGVLEYLLANIGKVIDGKRALYKASGNQSEWARRVRELRDEFGYQILTHKDRADLKQGQYLMLTAERRPAFARGISKETRAFVLDRNGFTCQMCGLAAGDPDPYNPERKVRLVIGHIIDKSKGGSDEANNLRALCTNCNEGLQNIALPRADLVHLLSQIRRAPIGEQKAVLKWLEEKFKERT